MKNIPKKKKIILFDRLGNLCDASVQFIVKRRKELAQSNEINTLREIFVEKDKYYIRKDGLTNPANFVQHRNELRSFNEAISLLSFLMMEER